MRPSDPRLREQLAPARRQLLGVVGAGVVSSVLVMTQAWVVTGLVVAVVRDGDVAGWGIATVCVLGARSLTGVVGDRWAGRAAAIVGTALRRRVLGAALRSRGTTSTGEVSVLATRGVTAAEPYLTRYVPALVLATLLPPLTVVAIATQDLLSALIVLATLPLVPVFGALVGLATRDRAEQQWRAMASLSGHFLDVVRGLPTLVAHRRARAQSGRIRAITEQYRRASLGTLRIAFASSAVLELVATLSVALVAVTVGVRLASGSLGLHTALLVLLLAPEAYWPLRKVGAEFHAAAEGVATFEAVHALLAAVDAEVVTGGSPTIGDLSVDAVSVVHPGRTTPALASLTARIPARGITVVTGPSGAGKSTLLSALAGLLPPSSGSVTVDGQPIGGTDWQRQVAWLPQRPHFVAGSIADNLRLARPDATDLALWAVLRRVALEERVRATPDGLLTILGEDGATLSAGERARLALARIVLADRPWVLLDEPTAHLDDLTEQVIADTLVELGRRGAVVVVAHRPAVLALADRVLEIPGPGPSASVTAPAPPPARRATTPPGVDAPEQMVPPTGRALWSSALLGSLASASGVALTATAGWLIVQASTRPAVLTLLVAIVAVRTFGIARPVLRYAERLHSHDAALRLLAQRRVQVYDAIVPLTPARLGRRRGDVLTSIVDDVDGVVDHALRVQLPIRTTVLVSVVASAVAALLLPAAGLVLAAYALGAGVLAHLVARLGARRAEQRSVVLRAQLSTEVVESIQVADELQMWQATGPAVERVARTSNALGTAATSATTWLGWARAVVLGTTGVTMAGMALLASDAVASGSLSGPMAALLVLLPLALAEVVAPVADAGALLVRTRAAALRLSHLEHTAPAVRDTVGVGVPFGSDVTVSAAQARWERTAPLTPSVSLDLRAGERVALVGPSGSGKSTLAALLLRFLDPVSGRVELGGTDSRTLPLDEVRRLIGLVDDDPHVFATTVVENIRLARPSATDAEVDEALRRARLGDWLDALPDGLDTWLGDGHAQVSGGERARLGLARSFLADPPVLVLDEPAAHLDHATATELAHEILSGPRARAVLWITHSDVGLDLVDRVVTVGVPAVLAAPTPS